jgi:hypothetical protein
MPAEVVALPLRPRVCSNCEYGYIGSEGVYCIQYQEMIYLESAAADCESFEEE